MIELINEFVILQEKLDEDFGIIGINHNDKEVHMNEKESIITLAKNENLHISDNPRDDHKFPFYISAVYEGYEFFAILTEKEYQEYKKATAPTVAKKK